MTLNPQSMVGWLNAFPPSLVLPTTVVVMGDPVTGQTYIATLGQLAAGAGDLVVNGLTIGRGTGNVATNTALGKQALLNNTTGIANTGVGYQALANNLDAAGNTGVGFGSLAGFNTGNGANTALGYQSLPVNTSGTQNVACGYWALQANVTGDNNAACGYIAMQSNVSGSYNAALGYAALNSSTGSFNTGCGGFALYVNQGTLNTSVGYFSLHANTSGNRLTAVGVNSLLTNASGSGNVALGYFAGAYELGSDAFYVDNQDRANTAGDKAKALLYGTFNATAASQTLAINAGAVTMLGTLTGVTQLTASSGTTTPSGVFNSTGAGSGGTISVNDTGALGANIKFSGNGGTTPNKYIRAQGGNLEFVNSGYAAVVATLSDAGAFTAKAGFGCNTKTAQGAFTLGAASTDLPTVIALANNIRSALIANGIGA